MTTRLGALLRITNEQVEKASRGTMSSYVINAPHQYGQPMPEVALNDTYGLITPERMREIVVKTPTAASCLNTTIDFLQGIRIGVKHKDAGQKADPAVVTYIEQFLEHPNPEDNGLDLKKMLWRDLFTIGQGALEIEYGPSGRIANLWPLDAARLRLDYDEHGTLLGYNMLSAHGIPIQGPDGIHAFMPNQVIYFRRDPVSHSRYPLSRIEQLFATAVIEDLMMYYISLKFTDSNVPFGVFDMGDITEDELKRAIATWNNQTQNAQHKITLTSSKGMKWFPFGFHLKDLEAPALLAEARRKIMGILGVTENELGESQDVNKSNGYNLSFTFKKRALEPLLNAYCQQLTARLVGDLLGFTDYELYYEPIDSRDELLESQIDQIYFDAGILTINQIRNRRGDPNINGGEEAYVKTSSGYIPVSLLQAFAEAQLDALRATVQVAQAEVAQAQAQMAQGAAGGTSPPAKIASPGSLPLIRSPAFPDRGTTPLGSGSSTVKFKYPTPKVKPPTQRPARGPVEANQRAGLRKDDATGGYEP